MTPTTPPIPTMIQHPVAGVPALGLGPHRTWCLGSQPQPPHTKAGRCPFEAVAVLDPNLEYAPIEQWWWSLHQPADDDPTLHRWS